MTEEELLRELCCINVFPEDEGKPEKAGSIFVHPCDAAGHDKVISTFMEQCDIPPLVTSDFEEGPGAMIKGATTFPSYYGTSYPQKWDAVEKMGAIAALESRKLGYNWTLAPCADITLNPDCPTTTTRAAAGGATEVLETARAYVRGCQANGLIATAKHFPGDGTGTYDQHLTTPENTMDLETWRKTYGHIYKTLIDDGVMSIMPGHISLPCYDDPDDFNGVYPPATTSKKLLTDLLRKELGFDGIIVSDAVNMGGFAGFCNRYEACTRFLEAGGDILLFAIPDKSFLKEMNRLIGEGKLHHKTLLNRVQRLLSFKQQLGLWQPTSDARDTVFSTPPVPYDPAEHQEQALEATRAAIHTVRDRQGLLPLPASARKILHVILPVSHTRQTETVSGWTRFLKESGRFDVVDEWIDPGNFRISTAAIDRTYDCIICSLVNDYHFGTNVIRMHGLVTRNLMKGWMHMGTPVVFVCHYHPYTHLEYAAVMNTVVNTCGTTPTSYAPLTDMLSQPAQGLE